MIYKPENVKLVIAHDGVEREVSGFYECSIVTEEQIEWLLDRVSKTKEDSKKSKTKSTLVKHLTKCEIESLRQNKRDAYALMMKMN